MGLLCSEWQPQGLPLQKMLIVRTPCYEIGFKNILKFGIGSVCRFKIVLNIKLM